MDRTAGSAGGEINQAISNDRDVETAGNASGSIQGTNMTNVGNQSTRTDGDTIQARPRAVPAEQTLAQGLTVVDGEIQEVLATRECAKLYDGRRTTCVTTVQ